MNEINQPQFPASRPLRLLTYNIHSCRGRDGKVDPARIAEVIARCRPDIAALQEVDVGRARSGGVDQAQMIAAHLNMKAHFHPCLHVEGELYGDAILTALPGRVVRAGQLPSIGEPRGAIWMSFDLGGTHLQVVNTHLGLRGRERVAQVAHLFGPGWLGGVETQNTPTILLGDFNAVPLSPAYRRMARELRDAHAEHARRPKATFPARFPLLRLDHIFVSGGIQVIDAQVNSDILARTASDHLPLTATLSVPMQSDAVAGSVEREQG